MKACTVLDVVRLATPGPGHRLRYCNLRRRGGGEGKYVEAIRSKKLPPSRVDLMQHLLFGRYVLPVDVEGVAGVLEDLSVEDNHEVMPLTLFYEVWTPDARAVVAGNLRLKVAVIALGS